MLESTHFCSLKIKALCNFKELLLLQSDREKSRMRSILILGSKESIYLTTEVVGSILVKEDFVFCNPKRWGWG